MHSFFLFLNADLVNTIIGVITEDYVFSMTYYSIIIGVTLYLEFAIFVTLIYVGLILYFLCRCPHNIIITIRVLLNHNLYGSLFFILWFLPVSGVSLPFLKIPVLYYVNIWCTLYSWSFAVYLLRTLYEITRGKYYTLHYTLLECTEFFHKVSKIFSKTQCICSVYFVNWIFNG